MGKGKLDIISDLKKLGICPGDKVLMHSSYKSLGTVDGGIDTFLDALMELLGPDGTLMLPTFTYDYVTLSNPVFDIRYTMSNVGYTTEVFRKKPGVVRSLHPTHSLAVWGKDKEKYIKELPLPFLKYFATHPVYEHNRQQRQNLDGGLRYYT